MRPGIFVRLILFVSLGIASGSELILKSVEVKGSRRPLELQTRAGEPYEPSTVTADVRKLWSTGWFDDIRVEQPSPGRVVFQVKEKPRLFLREVRFEPDAEKRKLKLQPGTPIDEMRAHEIASDLRRQLLEDGHSEASVDPELLPHPDGSADLLLKVEPGPKLRVREVEFTGDLGINEQQLQKALSAMRARTRFPFLWKSRPGFSGRAVDADLARVRSLYLTHGYFDAKVGPAETVRDGSRTFVTVPIEAGRQYDSRITLYNAGASEAPESMAGLCKCLLAERRAAEREGRIDFQARVQLDLRDSADLARVDAFLDPGPQYYLGRLVFRGNHILKDSTLRRAMRLDEGDLLDPRKLEKSVARLGRMPMLEPLSEDNILVNRKPLANTADVTITVKETPRGRWTLSGPALPLRIAGPFQAAISSRLPAWGSGILEASTYYATLSFTGLSGPIARAIGLTASNNWLPFVALHRPLIPGQEWTSGFTLSPQLDWQMSLLNYGAGQLHGRLPVPGVPATALAVPVERDSTYAFLICEQRPSRWGKVARIAPMALDLLLTFR